MLTNEELKKKIAQIMADYYYGIWRKNKMKNKEKFAKEIVEIALSGNGIALKQGTLISCGSIDCKECEFFCDEDDFCENKLRRWAESEYVKPKVFTEKEKTIFEVLTNANWIARDEDGELYIYVDKPNKHNKGWFTHGNVLLVPAFSNAKFESVKWEDDNPTSREEILR